mmetsp:Transcript_7346/g.14415  ORF Transcript_7346/g.14415 Transcript_7346/m.14415 type:complete len:92 (+) Transcript_7346:503-778(+)
MLPWSRSTPHAPPQSSLFDQYYSLKVYGPIPCQTPSRFVTTVGFTVLGFILFPHTLSSASSFFVVSLLFVTILLALIDWIVLASPDYLLWY